MTAPSVSPVATRTCQNRLAIEARRLSGGAYEHVHQRASIADSQSRCSLCCDPCDEQPLQGRSGVPCEVPSHERALECIRPGVAMGEMGHIDAGTHLGPLSFLLSTTGVQCRIAQGTQTHEWARPCALQNAETSSAGCQISPSHFGLTVCQTYKPRSRSQATRRPMFAVVPWVNCGPNSEPMPWI